MNELNIKKEKSHEEQKAVEVRKEESGEQQKGRYLTIPFPSVPKGWRQKKSSAKKIKALVTAANFLVRKGEREREKGREKRERE